jgi:hypothetical protein
MQAAGFSYMCGIGGERFPAVRNNETSLTCQVAPGGVQVRIIIAVQLGLWGAMFDL